MLLAWFAGTVTLTFFAEPTESVLVLGPAKGKTKAIIAADAYLMGAVGPFLLLRTNHRGSVRQIYASGAWLVLPARRSGGCMSLREPRLPAK